MISRIFYSGMVSSALLCDSASHFDKKKFSHNYHIYMVSPQFGYVYVLLNYMTEKMFCHKFHSGIVFLQCKVLLDKNFIPQISQYGFSPVWVRLCIFKRILQKLTFHSGMVLSVHLCDYISCSQYKRFSHKHYICTNFFHGEYFGDFFNYKSEQIFYHRFHNSIAFYQILQ